MAFFGTLVLALHCYCRDCKIRAFFETLLSKKTKIWQLKKSQSNDKLLKKITCSSYHIE